MSEKRTNLEIIAPSIEEAVAKGLADLGLPEEAVEIDVLDPGSRGLFGLGSRQARVRLTIKGQEETEEPAEVVYVSAEPVLAPVAEPAVPIAAPRPAASEAVQTTATPAPTPIEKSEEDETALRVARETVVELLEKMKVNAEVVASFNEPEDSHSKMSLYVDIQGDDLSILIGPHAETLNALQYIASLIIGKELGRSVPMMVDVQGYRQRRALQIRQLARRMADQAIKTGRRQVLEPMPASERRLIHIELRNHPQVITESIGEDPRRKVTIIPK